jgi:hypothetical protein
MRNGELILELFEPPKGRSGRKVKVAEIHLSDISPGDLEKILQIQQLLGRTWKARRTGREKTTTERLP